MKTTENKTAEEYLHSTPMGYIYRTNKKRGFDYRFKIDEVISLMEAYLQQKEKERCTCGGYPDCICDITRKNVTPQKEEEAPNMNEVADYVVRKLSIDGVLDSHGNVKVKQLPTPQSIIPSEEEIDKEFPIKTEIRINDEDGIRLRERNYGARYGAKWALSKMKTIDRKDDLIKCCNHLKIVMTRGESWNIESAVNEYLEDK